MFSKEASRRLKTGCFWEFNRYRQREKGAVGGEEADKDNWGGSPMRGSFCSDVERSDEEVVEELRGMEVYVEVEMFSERQILQACSFLPLNRDIAEDGF